MTPQQDIESLTENKRLVNARIREHIEALLVKREALAPDEDHLRDFIDLGILYFKRQMDMLNQEATVAAMRMRDYSPYGRY